MSLPAAATPRRTHPLGMIVGVFDGLRRAVLPAVAGAYGFREELAGAGSALLFVGFLLGFGGLVAFLRWWRTTYVVGAEDIRLEQGVVSRAARSVPFERIQDVSLEQKLLARLLGLVSVRFETGAGGKDEIALSYLTEAEGERLRELVRERREDEKSIAAVELSRTEASETVFAIGPRRLVTFGLFEFSLAAVAVLAGAAQQFDFLLPFDLWDFDGWQQRLAGPGDWLAHLGRWAQVVGGAIAVVSLVAAGFATGLVRVFTRDWGFRLDRTARGFRRRRGLLTRTDVVMPAHRVQALQVRTRAIRKRFGWHALKFVSLAQDSGSASHVVAPFAKLPEIEPIARDAGFALPGAEIDWLRPSRRAYVDRALISGIVPLLIAGGLLLSEVPWLAVVPVVIGGLLALRQVFLWSHDRNAIDSRQLYRRHGWLAPRTDIASRVKLQSVEIRQGPLARRGGYATLHLGLAGGSFCFAGIPRERARQIRDAVVESIATTDFARLARGDN